MGREVQNALVSCLRFLPDDTYLKLIYRLKVGKKLNLDNPQTYTEKIQWLKIHDRKPIYTTMVDKYEAKSNQLLEVDILFRHWEFGTLSMKLILRNCQNDLF